MYDGVRLAGRLAASSWRVTGRRPGATGPPSTRPAAGSPLGRHSGGLRVLSSGWAGPTARGPQHATIGEVHVEREAADTDRRGARLQRRAVSRAGSAVRARPVVHRLRARHLGQREHRRDGRHRSGPRGRRRARDVPAERAQHRPRGEQQPPCPHRARPPVQVGAMRRRAASWLPRPLRDRSRRGSHGRARLHADRLRGRRQPAARLRGRRLGAPVRRHGRTPPVRDRGRPVDERGAGRDPHRRPPPHPVDAALRRKRRPAHGEGIRHAGHVRGDPRPPSSSGGSTRVPRKEDRATPGGSASTTAAPGRSLGCRSGACRQTAPRSSSGPLSRSAARRRCSACWHATWSPRGAASTRTSSTCAADTGPRWPGVIPVSGAQGQPVTRRAVGRPAEHQPERVAGAALAMCESDNGNLPVRSRNIRGKYVHALRQ